MENTKVISYCSNSYGQDRINRNWVNRFVSDAVEILQPYKGGLLYLCGYTPPFRKTTHIEGIRFDPGYLCLSFCKPGENDEDAGFDIIFGYYENGEFVREIIYQEDILTNPGCCQVVAYNFDEAWQIICLIGERLEISEVRLTCGGA